MTKVNSEASCGLPGLTRLDFAAASLFSSTWSTHRYDFRLRDTLCQVCNIFNIIGFGVRLADRGEWMCCYSRQLDAGLKKQVSSVLEGLGVESTVAKTRCPLSDEHCIIISVIPEDGSSQNLKSGVCFALYDQLELCRRYERTLLPRLEETLQNSFLPLLFDVMRQRERRFRPFDAIVSRLYWDSTSLYPVTEVVDIIHEIRPPWDEEQPQQTATVSVDLRKSTFCMEQANDAIAFGLWLDQLVQILNSICHANGGVFDKFTGDGALMHFLDDECTAIRGQSAVQSAFACSVDIHRAIRTHMSQLVKILRFTSEKIGAAVGIDVGPVFWSLDYRDNPVTVGRSVVGACRLCSAAAGVTRMTNIAYQQLRRQYVDIDLLMKPAVIQTKEFTEEMRILVMQMETPPFASHFGIGQHAVDVICQRVIQRTMARNELDAPNNS